MTHPKVLLPLRRCLATLLLICAARLCAQTEYTVFADSISYASWSGDQPRMNAVWSQNTGNAPVVVAEPAPATNRYFAIGNGVIRRNLDVTLTEEFDLRIDLLHSAAARGIWVGLFNAAGTEGYGFLWDSGAAGSQGNVSIRRFSVATSSSLVFNAYGTALGASTPSGRSPVDGPLAGFRLTWNRATSTLTLFVDGVEKLSRTDAAFASFARVFVSGNGTSAAPSKFDNIAVSLRDATPPVVAVAAPTAGAALSGVCRVTAEAPDNLGLAGVQFQLDGANLGGEFARAPYTIEWDTDAAAPGAHTLTAVARDMVGNTTTSPAVTVTVAGFARLSALADAYVRSGTQARDNFGQDPVLEAGQGPAPETEEREIYLKFDLGDVANVGRGILRLYGSRSGEAVSLEVRSTPNIFWIERGIRWVNKPESGAETLAVTAVQETPAWHEWDVTPVLQAARAACRDRVTLVVRRAGAAGGLATFHAREHLENQPQLLVIPDRTPPGVTLARPLDGAVVSRMVPVTAGASDNRAVAGVQFKLDGVPLGAEQSTAPFGLIWNSDTVVPGDHVITAVARDAAGNRTTSAPVTITVARSTAIAPAADAFVDSERATRNFGTEPLLEAAGSGSTGGGVRDIYLRFRLSATGPIGHGVLRMYGGAGSATATDVAEVRSSTRALWTEHGIRWLNRPEVSADTHAVVALQSAPGWHEWDLTSFLQAQRAAGRDTVTLVVRASAAAAFHSRENPLNPPELVVAVLPPTNPPVAQFEAEAFNARSGAGAGLEAIGELNDGDWIRFDAVDLGEGYLTFQARVASSNVAANYGELELRLGAPDGERIAALRVLNTRGEAVWEVQTAAIAGGAGTHDLYVVARGGNGASVCSLDWIKLRRDLLPRGATMPFVTYEAEAGVSSGTLNGSGDPFHRYGASERGYVWLAAAGQSVEWTAQVPANRLTLRYGIPQGASGTISVYVNGGLRVVPLSPTHCYDASAVTTKPRRYDEVVVAVDIAAGDVVKVKKGADDLLAWYAIDLVDLEMAPPPAPARLNALSVADFPRLAGETHDGLRIQRCLDAAASGARQAFLPAGDYTTNTRIIVPAGVELRGAGLWHTVLHNPIAGTQFSNVAGFFIGSNAILADLKITGVATQRSTSITAVRSLSSASGFTLENLHVQNMGDLMGWEIYSHATFRNCRVIGTYYDGLHLGDDAVTDCLVENCFFRGSGDDNIAQVNRADMGLATRNVVQFVTGVAQYWGRGIADIGGDDFTVRDCIFDGCFHAGVMIATESLSPSVSRPIQGFRLQRTTVMMAGHPATVLPGGSNHGGVHFWLDRNPMRDVKIEDSYIGFGETRGIRIDDTNHGDDLGRTEFNYNLVEHNPQGNYDDASLEIVPVLTGNTGF